MRFFEAAWRRYAVLLINTASLGLLCLGILAGRVLPPGLYTHGVGIDGHMLAWDGIWYRDIALHGYQWNPAYGTKLFHHQNIAFFPLYPLIDWAAMRLAGSDRPIFDILPGLGFGLWANVLFHRLAQKFTPHPTFATAVFAFWPACCFLVMGYPTGLINIFVMQTILNITSHHRWRAALWCGIGTAAAPTLVFVAAAIGLHESWTWWRSDNRLKTFPGLAAFGALSVSGLLAFMVFQAIRFGDPLSFVAAQRGFTVTPPFLMHVFLLFNPFWYTLGLQWGWTAIQNALHHNLLASAYGREVANSALQLVIDLIALVAWVVLLAAAWRDEKLRITAMTGWFILIGYVWFLATTDKNLTNGIRMLYPALAAFLVIGRWNIKPPLAALLLGVLALFAVLETALVAAGYDVI